MEGLVTDILKNPELGFAAVLCILLLVWLYRAYQNLEKRVEATLNKADETHRFYQSELKNTGEAFRMDIRQITERFSETQHETAKAIESLTLEVKTIKRQLAHERGWDDG